MENSFTYVIAFWGVLGWFVFRLVSGFVLLVAVRRMIRSWWAHVGFFLFVHRRLVVTSSCGNNSDQSSKNENLSIN